MTEAENFFKRANQLLDRLENILPATGPASPLNGEESRCWRCTTNGLEPVKHVSDINMDDLQCIERQKSAIEQNVRQFVNGLPANNALLWGPRGTGKSSLIKAIFNAYSNQGLKLIEVDRDHLQQLPLICDALYESPGRYIIFCDDLSFEANDPGYKAIKVIMDGSITQTPENVLIHATSNRRHLIPEYMSENIQSYMEDGELHLSEGIEEKLALSERFGLWLAFHPFNQKQYLEIVDYWLQKLGVNVDEPETVHKAALQWALEHGSRSGRSANLFARDWAGKTGLGLV